MKHRHDFTVTLRRSPSKSDADICREQGWVVGTRLIGDDGYGPTVIEITGLGEQILLAKKISHNGKPHQSHEGEGTWTLSCRDWKVAPEGVA